MLLALTILAAFMAIFGILGYMRGLKAALVTLGITLLALYITQRLGDELVALINGIYKGFKFLFSGGLALLSGGGDISSGQLAAIPPLINPGDPGPALALIFLAMTGLALLFSTSKVLRSATSLAGLVVGLISGYIVGYYMLRMLYPNLFPAGGMPGGLGGGFPGAALLTRFLTWLNATFSHQTLGLLVAIAIAIFVLLAMSFARKGSNNGKKG
jgi:hypothetical protein